jgi:hypothetical protein
MGCQSLFSYDRFAEFLTCKRNSTKFSQTSCTTISSSRLFISISNCCTKQRYTEASNCYLDISTIKLRIYLEF